MIDPHQTGAYIAQLRKERDWTQVELADRLNVTHQAVSRWETGDSFPDLITLAQLAQLFGVRMESLLDGNSTHTSPAGTRRDALLAELSAGHAERAAELAKVDPSDLETVIKSAPLTRPSLINKVVKNMSEYSFSLEQVMGLAPFISQELLDAMVAGLNEKPGVQSLVGLAPFMSRPALNRLVSQLEGSMNIKYVIALAPHLDKTTLDLLVERSTLDKIEGFDVIALAPFVSRSVLDKLLERLPAEELGIDRVISLAPFVDHSRLSRLVSNVGLNPMRLRDLTALAPFLDRPTLQQLVLRVPPGMVNAGTLVALAPFLDQPTLEALIRGQRPQAPVDKG